MPYLEVEKGIRLYYEEFGSGNPILFVHGRGAAYEAWTYQLENLRKNFRVIAFDLRGHGFSDKPSGPYNHEAFARDLKNFIRQLDLKDVTVVGWSTGSFTIEKYAALYGLHDPISKIALVGSTPVFAARRDFPHALTLSFFDRMKKNHRKNHPEAVRNFVKALFGRPPDNATSAWLFNMIMRTPLPVLLDTLEANIAMDYRNVLSEIDIPTLILQGKNDKLCFHKAAEYMNKQITSSKLVSFKQSGHSPFLEETSKFNATLSNFAKSTS